MIRGEPVCCAPVGDHCGEGVLWCADEQAVYWTDINRFLIHRFDPRSKSVQSWFFDQPVTSILLTDRASNFLVCLGSGVIFWDPSTDVRMDQRFKLPGWPTVRLNDAAISPSGSLFVGSMLNNVRSDGSEGAAGGSSGILFRVDPNGSVSECDTGFGICNTIVWSPDHSWFYLADSLANTIWRYHYNEAAQSISGREVFFKNFDRGLPDGSTIDSDGYLWNCRYGGGCIVRISPNGKVNAVVDLPTSNITNCTFGGDSLSELFVTSAISFGSKGDRLAGSLFSVQTDAQGLPEHRFRLSSPGKSSGEFTSSNLNQ